MIKKIFGCFIVVLMVLVVVPSEVFATAPVDQMCGSVSDNITPDISNQKVYQTFVPTKNTIDAVGAFMSTDEDHSVKIRVLIYNISSIWNFRLVVDHFSLITNTIGYKVIDLPDTHLDPGYYALSFQTLHAEDHVRWIGTHYECYPNGNAIIDDENLPDANMTFTVYGYDTENEPSIPSEQADPSDDNATADSSTPSQQEPTANDSSIPTSTLGSSEAVSAEMPNADLSGVNNKNDQVQPMSGDELAAFLAWVKEDHEANRSHGIFGLSGVLGSILTWPVVIGFGVFFFLLLIIIIIILVVRKRPHHSTDQPQAK